MKLKPKHINDVARHTISAKLVSLNARSVCHIPQYSDRTLCSPFVRLSAPLLILQ